MKKIGILLLVLVLSTTFGMAQNRSGQRNFNPENMAKHQTEQLKEALGLNKDQGEKVYDLYLELGKKMVEMRKNMQAGGGFEGMREKMGKIHEEQNKKMKEILTAEQWKKYEKYQEERRARRGQGRSGGNR